MALVHHHRCAASTITGRRLHRGGTGAGAGAYFGPPLPPPRGLPGGMAQEGEGGGHTIIVVGVVDVVIQEGRRGWRRHCRRQTSYFGVTIDSDDDDGDRKE